MSNPFLFDDDEADAQNEPAANPFLLESGPEQDEDANDNPFVAQASNPFAFDAADDEELPVEPEVVQPPAVAVSHDVEDKAMSFFGTTITEDDDHDVPIEAQQQTVLVEPIDANESAKKPPPPRPTPPNQQTQDLISSVADHLDQTSSHLLDRIPKTRTPSPVSMRDLHSPSPTPDTANLLMSDTLESNNVLRSDNPFADLDDDIPSMAVQQEKPTRPVPPRPGPPPTTYETKPESQPAEADLFDFGTSSMEPKPPQPKTNQDIMNLFAPKAVEQQKPDLLMDEPIRTNIAPVNIAAPAPAPAPAPVPVPVPAPVPAPSAAPVKATPPVRPPVPPPPQRANVTVPAPAPAPAPIEQPAQQPKRPSIPNVPSAGNSPPIESNPMNEEPLETAPISSIKINDVPYNAQDNGFLDIEKSDTISDNSSAVESSIGRTPGVSTPFYTGGPDAQYLDRSQSPVSKEEMIKSYINETTVSPPTSNPFGSPEAVAPPVKPPPPIFAQNDEFDAFAAKFDSVKKDDNTLLDGFGSSMASGYKSPAAADAWGASDIVTTSDATGFDADEGFDSFLAMQAPPEDESRKLAPPQSRGSLGSSIYAEDRSERSLPLSDEQKTHRSGSVESPSTPLFDEDTSQPLEDFPRITYTGEGWDMYLRQPNKKKITGQRFWKKIFLRMVFQGDTPVIQIFNQQKDKDPFQELPLQGCYSVSEISAQPFDQFGKIFTMKLQYIFYKERPGVRPGQITKAERITNKLSQFAAYAIQGDYQGVKEFGSDLKKLGLPVEHAPQISQLFKIGSHSYEDMKLFSVLVEEQFFKFNVHRDRALTYKFEEVQVTGVDEYYAEVTNDGHVTKQIARVRIFLLAFLTGMPTIELGVNDLWRQGKEVVGRHDIIPVATEEWIRLEGVEFHSCVQLNEYERSRLIRFQPPDACYIELMRFRVRPPKNRELPLQLKAVWCVTGKRVELRADVLVPGCTSRKLGQIPCEDVSIRFPIPECWIYLFRVEKHFRYGSVKSAHRRTGKIKGIERILGTVDQLQESLIEVTSGQAKYEHHHRSIVWRCPRLPKEGQGAYTTHQMVVRMALTSYDQIPDKLAEHCFVEYTMPQTTVSHTTVRSVSVQDSDSDDPPEKCVRYLARYEYKVGIEYTQGQEQNAYLAATYVKKEEKPKEEKPAPVPEAVSDSDSDSN